MKLTLDQKEAIVVSALGLMLAVAVIYIVEREKKQDSDDVIPITDESILAAAEAYRSALEAGEGKAVMDEINVQLKKEFGVYVEHKPLRGKFLVYNKKGKLLKELDA